MVGECHFYSAELAGELVLFDTGPPTEEAWELLCREVDLQRLKHVFITHWHVDHCGQVGRIQEESGASVYLSELDALKVGRQQERLQLLAAELGRLGLDERFQEGLYRQGSQAGIFADPPHQFDILEESPAPARLGVDWLNCAGHSQSDLIFRIGPYAISGDILLPNLFQSPLLEVDLRSLGRRFDNYGAYCDSLKRFRSLRGVTILPGHRRSVESLEGVVHFYVNKLRERAALLGRFPAGTPVSEIVATLCGDIHENPVLAYLKASEVVFMQDYLADPERIETALRHFDAVEQEHLS